MGNKHTGKYKFDDPDIRAICVTCCGPVFVDELGPRCPDCVQVFANIHEVHKIGPPQQLYRAERVVVVPQVRKQA